MYRDFVENSLDGKVFREYRWRIRQVTLHFDDDRSTSRRRSRIRSILRPNHRDTYQPDQSRKCVQHRWLQSRDSKQEYDDDEETFENPLAYSFPAISSSYIYHCLCDNDALRTQIRTAAETKGALGYIRPIFPPRVFPWILALLTWRSM